MFENFYQTLWPHSLEHIFYFVVTTVRIPNVRSWKIIVFWVVTEHNIWVATFCPCHHSILILRLFFLRPLFPFLSSWFLFNLISLWLHNCPFPNLNTSLTLQPDSQSSTNAAKVSLSCIRLFGRNMDIFNTDRFPPRTLFFWSFLILLNFFWQKYGWLGQVY
jgi:hypothetical protein